MLYISTFISLMISIWWYFKHWWNVISKAICYGVLCSFCHILSAEHASYEGRFAYSTIDSVDSWNLLEVIGEYEVVLNARSKNENILKNKT